jgi:hypothetical protein
MPGLHTINIVNGNTRPEGSGTINIQTILSNRTTKTIRLYNCLYIPTYLINLFLYYRLLKKGGYIRDSYLFTKDGSEIGSYDNKLYIIKAPNSQHESDQDDALDTNDNCEDTVAYPAALEQIDPDIELWHQRFGHLSLDSVRATRKLVTSLDFQDKEVPPTITRLCDSCERGRLIKSVRKRIDNRPLHALDRVYIDVVIVTPKSFLGKAHYGLMCTDSATIAQWL